MRPSLFRFALDRLIDKNGVSGVGRVAVGVVMPTGKVVTEWRKPHTSTGVYKDLDEFKAVHVDGHPETKITWYDKWCQYCGYDNPPYSAETKEGVSLCYQCECENVHCGAPQHEKQPVVTA